MKVLIKIFSIAFLILFFASCDTKVKTKEMSEEKPETIVVAENLKQIKVDIKGMTCEIGCARLIQSKLYKADGITFAKVSFEDSSGIVSFDEKRINEDEIKTIIERTAGGDIYTVASIHAVDLDNHSKEIQ